MEYLPRLMDASIRDRLASFGALLLEGPKWCGKTTSALEAASSSLLVADPRNDFANRMLAELDPALALEGATPRLVDEWQEVPKLWDAIRFECDRRHEKGLFILTGSATPKDTALPAHSGAGRIARLRMDTMSLAEQRRSNGAVSLAGLFGGERYRATGSLGMRDIAELVIRGGWPAAVDSPPESAALMAQEYIATVAEVDVSAVDGVRRDPERVRALLTSLARNESTLATNKTIVGDLGSTTTRQTVATYLNVLARLHVVDDIPAWNPALRSPIALRSAKKRHMVDTSLAAAALGADVESLVRDVKTLGLLFESLALHDLGVYARAIGGRLYHYHDSQDLEVDAIVALANGAWGAFEVKLGAAHVGDAVEQLMRLERRMLRAGNAAPSLKCVIVGFGMPAHVTDTGVQVVPIDTLGG